MDLRDELQSALGSSYTIERELGGGGMSRVYLAEETSLRRKVVVKILPSEMAGQVSIDRFKREISLAATLQHAHIVPLLTAGDAGGLPYFTMPYVRGESLRARISKQGELPVNEAMRILREVASALAFAHDAGVVHRDIKPDNVLMAGGAAMVTDFGVAKALSESSSDGGSALTSLGIALGTPAYMSPEQASADPLTDHRADIYAWGVLAYELLTGGTPFSGRPASAMLAAHVNEKPEPIGKRRAQIPASLASLVMRCLEKRAADRPQHGTELVRALDEMVTPSGGLEPTSALTATSAQRVGARRRWILLGVGAAVVVAALYFGAQRLTSQPAAPRTIAVLPFENKTGDSTITYLIEGMSDRLRDELTMVAGVTVKSPSWSRSARVQNIDSRGIAKLGVGAVLQAVVSRAANRLHLSAELVSVENESLLWSGTYDSDAKQFSSLKDSVSRAVASKLRLTTAAPTRGTVSPEARDAYEHGHFLSLKTSEVDLRKALKYFEQALAKDSTMAEAYAGMAWTWVSLADAFVSPAEAYPKTKELAAKAIALDPNLASSYVAMGGALAFHDWDFAGAERNLKHAIELNPQSPEAHSTLGVALLGLRRTSEALAEADSAVKVDPLSAFPGFQRIFVLYPLRMYREVLAQYRRVIENEPAFFYFDSYDGMAYRELGLLDSAFAAFERIRPLIGGQPMSGLGITYARAGRRDEAIKTALALEEWSKHHYYAPEFIAAVWASVGDMDRAFKWMDQVFVARSSLWILFRDSDDFAALRKDARWAELEKRAGVK